jgi:hypothetical protein
MAVPKVSAVAEPNVAIVRFAHDVAPVGGSVIVHVHVNIDMGTSIYVGSAMMAAPTVMAFVSPSMASAMPFRVRCRHDSKPERRRDRKNETNLLQHFCFPP